MGLKEDLKAIATLGKELKKLETENKALATKLASDMKGKVPMEFLVDGAIKSYMDAVKKSQGLTSVRPSVIKVLNTATVKPTKAAITKASTDIKGHLAEVQKENKDEIKTDKKIAAKVKAFEKDLTEVMTVLKKQKVVG